MISKKNNRIGFTLVELLIAITILGIIMAVAIPLLSKVTNKSKETQNDVFNDSLLVGARLYNDSYENDTFGNRQYGCAKVPYSLLLNKGLVKKLEANNYECGYFLNEKRNDSLDSSGVIIRKVKNKYYYETILFCKDKENNYSEIDDYVSGTEKVYFNKIDSSYCDEDASDDNTPPFVYYVNNNYRYFYNKSNLPKPSIKVVDNGSGLVNKIEVNVDWSNGATKHDLLTFSQHRATGSTNWRNITLPSELSSNTANGTFKLTVTEKSVYDMANNGINSSNRTNYIIPYNSGDISAFHPQKITDQTNKIVTPDTFRVENTKPTLAVTLKTGSTTINSGKWVNSDVTPTISMSDGNTGIVSGLYKLEKKVGSGSWSTIWTNTTFTNDDAKNKSITDTKQTDEQNQTYTYRVTDWAGNVSDEVSVVIRIDKTKPECTKSGESTSWAKGTRTITYGCDDKNGAYKSTCETTNATKNFGETNKTTKTASHSWTIKDKAGNTNSCSYTLNIYIDNISPSCSWSGESTTWTNSDRTITVSGSDADSGMKSGKTTKTWTFKSNTKTSSLSYTIEDNVGNTTECKKTANVYVDKCTSYDTNCGNYGSCNCSTNKKSRSCTKKSNFGSGFSCGTYNDTASCSCCTTPIVSHWTKTNAPFSCYRGGETVNLDGASHFEVTGCGDGLYGYMCYHNPGGASCAWKLSYSGTSYHQDNGAGHMVFQGNHWVYYRSSEYARGHLCNSSGQCVTYDENLPY